MSVKKVISFKSLKKGQIFFIKHQSIDSVAEECEFIAMNPLYDSIHYKMNKNGETYTQYLRPYESYYLYKGLDCFSLTNKTECTCGAVYTSFKNHHLLWCNLVTK